MATAGIAIGVVSGGLDSLLAVRLVESLGFAVRGLHFAIGFEAEHLRCWQADPDATPPPPPALAQTAARIEVCDIRDAFMELLADPAHGYGAGANPCIDCHAHMLALAGRRLEAEGAAFVFTGEVLGQRPMSQNRQALDSIARISGLGERLLRPLSGALLPPSAAERAGLLRRADLLDIQGRSRQRQLALAARWGLQELPTPAGGCLLTDPYYAARVHDRLARRPGRRLLRDDPLLLSVGRHLVLPDDARAVVGRHQQDNAVIARFAPRGVLLEATAHAGPTTLVEGRPSAAALAEAARLTARYGQGRDQPRVEIAARWPDGSSRTLAVEPRAEPVFVAP
jgi:tRNA U34 2-thiouridine synthase MnmA/TrmU